MRALFGKIQCISNRWKPQERLQCLMMMKIFLPSAHTFRGKRLASTYVYRCEDVEQRMLQIVPDMIFMDNRIPKGGGIAAAQN